MVECELTVTRCSHARIRSNRIPIECVLAQKTKKQNEEEKKSLYYMYDNEICLEESWLSYARRCTNMKVKKKQK